jgi:hypothetical protein
MMMLAFLAASAGIPVLACCYAKESILQSPPHQLHNGLQAVIVHCQFASYCDSRHLSDP